MVSCDKKRIHICFVTPKAYPLFNPDVQSVFGGAEVDVYFLAMELAKDCRFKVSCVVADYGQPDVEVREGVELVKSLDFKENMIRGTRKIWQSLGRVDADIYFMKTASAGVGLVAWFCRRRGKHFVYRTAHSMECDGSWLKEHPILGKVFSWSLKKARVVFAQNQIDAEQLFETVGVSAVVVPNGHRFVSEGTPRRDTVLWVARSVEFKKPMKFLDLAEAYPDEHFTMICQKATGDVLFDRIEERALGLENVAFISRVPFHQMEDYFQKAKVFVNTSDAEGFANTFIQAARCGTPILTLNVNPDDFLNRHQCGLCAEGDESRFREMLNDLLNPETAQALGQNGRAYAQKNHDIQVIVNQYNEIFKKICEFGDL